jgi:hypothetical protein
MLPDDRNVRSKTDLQAKKLATVESVQSLQGIDDFACKSGCNGEGGDVVG